MAALVNTTHGEAAGAATSIAASAASHTTGNLLVALIAYDELTGSINSVTDTAGNAYLQCAGAFHQITDTVDIWFVQSCTGNASNIVAANFSGSVSFRSIHVYQFSGQRTVTSFENAVFGDAAAATTVTSATFRLTTGGDICVALGSAAGSVTWTAAPGYIAQISTGGPDRMSQYRVDGVSGEQIYKATTNSAFNLALTGASFRIPDVAYVAPVASSLQVPTQQRY